MINLTAGLDFRLPQHRREVFLRFYEFHLKYKSHPGAVYFALPWLAKHYAQSEEDRLWMAFINGCSQNIVTTSIIYERFPRLAEIDPYEFNQWWLSVHPKFKAGSGWDADRKYFKIGVFGLPPCVSSYRDAVDQHGSQAALFRHLCSSWDPRENFRRVWDFFRKNVLSFGRLSTFSYLEYLRIQGLPIECDSLFLDDLKGSKSHRNGLCKVLGHDHLDWRKEPVPPPYDFPALQREADALLREAWQRTNHPDAHYFTLESTLCCYKSWHRPNRRYPNVYMDMFHDRIRYAEREWGAGRFDKFWQMRRECLPDHLRLEDNPWDFGVSKLKQNHYLLTGQVVMMDKEWPCFENNYEENCNIARNQRVG